MKAAFVKDAIFDLGGVKQVPLKRPGRKRCCLGSQQNPKHAAPHYPASTPTERATGTRSRAGWQRGIQSPRLINPLPFSCVWQLDSQLVPLRKLYLVRMKLPTHFMSNIELLVPLIISMTTDLIWIWTSDLEVKKIPLKRKVEQSDVELKYPLGS